MFSRYAEAMFSRSSVVLLPSCTQVRGMATLKEIRMRLKSVTNIQKITKSMKMVSAAKFSRAERELKPARSYGQGAQTFFERSELEQDVTKPNHLLIACTSDRGLCGAVHSSVVKAIKNVMNGQKAGIETKIVAIGDKSRSILQRQYAENILLHFNDIGKKPPVFQDASKIAQAITQTGYNYDVGTLFFNVFKSVVSYNTTSLPIFSLNTITKAEKLNVYDSLDEEVLRSYNEFALASLVYFALKECATSEQSARMTAMDGASKNAGEMIDKLTLTFNRTRQAVITKELTEIVSGAAALE